MPSFQTHIVNTLLRVLVKHRKARDFTVLRNQVERFDSKHARISKRVSVADETLGHVPCQWIRVPESSKKCLIVYFHGGAYCLRTPKAHSAFLSRLCRGVNAVGLMVDYRLAPENPFPAASDDCLAVYRWLISNGYDPEKIVLAGDSAGGCLTLSTLVRIRDEQLPKPACAVMFSPATDGTLWGESFVTNQKSDSMFKIGALLRFRNAYLQSTSPAHPIASPLHADHHDLPPLYFQVSGSELLRDSSVLAFQKARAAGVEAKLDILHGMPHCYQLFKFIPESEDAVKKVFQFIQSYI